MSLSSDAAIDRRRLKRRLNLWRLAALIAVVVAVLLGIARDNRLVEGDYVARLNVSGVITDDPARDRMLAHVAADPHVRALIVRIDSPGGTVVGGEALYLRLRDIARHKPVAAVMGTLATSGGYMTAIGADRIFARSGTVTGSIGVIMMSADITGLLDKLGIKPETIKSAPLKAVPNPIEKLTEEGRAATRAVVMDMYDQFVGMVAERRRMSPAEVRKLADGRIFTGRQALANRLIDAIGGETEARQWLVASRAVPAGLPVRTLTLGGKSDWLWGLFDDGTGNGFTGILARIVGKTLFSERLTLDGLVSVWHPDRR
jgi:protease-4